DQRGRAGGEDGDAGSGLDGGGERAAEHDAPADAGGVTWPPGLPERDGGGARERAEDTGDHGPDDRDGHADEDPGEAAGDGAPEGAVAAAVAVAVALDDEELEQLGEGAEQDERQDQQPRDLAEQGGDGQHAEHDPQAGYAQRDEEQRAGHDGER